MLQIISIREGKRVGLYNSYWMLRLHRSFNITARSDGLNCTKPTKGTLWRETITVAAPGEEHTVTVALKGVWKARLGLEVGQKVSIDDLVHDPDMVCLESNFGTLFDDDIDSFFEERFGPLEKREARPA